MDAWDETWDFVIVGSGAASIVASLVMQKAGKRPLVLEKTEQVGGSTALSGGVLWVPNNVYELQAGVPDTPEKAAAYLDACAGDVGRSEEHTSELQSLMRISYAVFCLKKKKT